MTVTSEPLHDTEDVITTDDGNRVLLSVLSLMLLVVGVVGLASGVDRVTATGMVLFLLIGPGAALTSFTRMPGGTGGRLVIAFGVSFTLLVALSMFAVYAGVWAPTGTLAVISVLTAVAHLYVLAADRERLRSFRSRGLPFDMARSAVAVAATAVCVAMALLSRDSSPPLWGFLRTVNPVWWVGIAVLLALTIVELRGVDSGGRHGTSYRRVPLPAILFAATITATPVLVYGAPRSQSSVKHQQLSDLIARTHDLRAAETIYNDWPGFFTTSAFLKDFAHIGNLISLSTWWPLVIVLIRLVAVKLLAERYLPNNSTAWLVSALVYLATPNGMDYYSPQSIGYTLGMIALWLAVADDLTTRKRVVLLLIVTVGFAPSHQLSPYIVGGALVVLALFRQLRPWWVPLVVLLPTLAWTLRNLSQVKRFVSPSEVGSTSNYSLPVQSVDGNPKFIVNGSIALTALILVIVGLLALATLIRERRSLEAWGISVASLVGFGAVFVTAYGNEGTFRAVFFAVPWLSILAARSLLRLGDATRSVWRLAVPVTLIIGTGCSLVGVYALDASNVVSTGDLAYLNNLRKEGEKHPDRNYLTLSLGAGNYPSVGAERIPNVRVFRATVGGVAQIRTVGRAQFAATIARQLNQTRDARANQIEVFSSLPVRNYADEYGQLPPSEYRAIDTVLSASPLWRVVYNRAGTKAWRLTLPASATPSS